MTPACIGRLSDREKCGAEEERPKPQESAEPGGQYVTARDFTALNVRLEWRNKTLFIDGLDEMRAGAVDGPPRQIAASRP